MSRKTEQIKMSISRLEEIQAELYQNAEGEKQILLCEQMKSEIENLRLWISMLYKYNGTSKSNAKIAASRENGKKGGRPPKFVSELKKQKIELEALLSDLHQKQITADFDEEEKINAQAQNAKAELESIEEKLSQAAKN